MADNPFPQYDNPLGEDGESTPDGSSPALTPRQIAEFIDAHRDELSRFIARKLGSDEMSRDILQDAYLRLSRRRSGQNIGNPRAFVFRIVANLVIDHQRLSANRLEHDSADETLHNIPEHYPDPEKHYQYRQHLSALEQAMAELPDITRRVFYLNRVEGFSYSEVAANLKLSESTVAKHLAQAIKHCRDRLRQH